MSFAIDIYYVAPEDTAREARIGAQAIAAGGQFDWRDLPTEHSRSICLTFDFPSLAAAELAAVAIRTQGEHVEGPYDYGD